MLYVKTYVGPVFRFSCKASCFATRRWQVLGNPEEACKMARQAFEDAIAELDSVSEDSYKVHRDSA